jgi:hypothetical protein
MYIQREEWRDEAPSSVDRKKMRTNKSLTFVRKLMTTANWMTYTSGTNKCQRSPPKEDAVSFTSFQLCDVFIFTLQ